MSQVLRINATDQRISLLGNWLTLIDPGIYCYSDCQFFLMFRGTGFKIYCNYSPFALNATGILTLELDGVPMQDIQLNNTTCIDGVTPEYGKNMEGGDHQLAGRVRTNRSFYMEYLEVENLSGDGFDLLSAGPTAQDVPAQAVIVDNTDPAIIYHNKTQWLDYSDGLLDYRRSVSYTVTKGASLSYSFDGVSVWFYGHLCFQCSAFKVSIDGSTPQRSTTAYSSNLNQQLIWSNTSLGPGRHTITLTNDDSSLSKFHFDFFRVLPGPGTSDLSASSTTNFGELPTTTPPTNQNQTNRVLLAVGLTLGLLVFIGVVLCGVFHMYRRRGRRLADPNAHSVSPYAISPIGRADQQSGIPQFRKGVPQPAQPSDSPMATVDPAMFSSGIGLGPPPSYVTRNCDWRVDAAQ